MLVNSTDAFESDVILCENGRKQAKIANVNTSREIVEQTIGSRL